MSSTKTGGLHRFFKGLIPNSTIVLIFRNGFADNKNSLFIRLNLGLVISMFFVATVSMAQQSLTEQAAVLKASLQEKKIEDTAYINRVHHLCSYYVYIYPDSVLALLSATEPLIQSTNYKAGTVEMLSWKGEAFASLRGYDSAIYYQEKALELATKIGRKDKENSILNRLGAIYTNKGDYVIASEKFYGALKIAEVLGSKQQISAVYNNLANIFYFQKKYDEAERYYIKALEIYEEIHDTLSIAISHNNLGGIYLEKKEYQKALRYLTTSVSISKKLNHSELSMAARVSMAQTYSELDSVDKANALFNEVITDAAIYHDALYAAYGYLGKSKLEYKENRFADALVYANSALAYADTIGQKNLVMESHELLAKIHESLGNDAKALYNFKLFKSFSDSLNSLEAERAAAMQEASYNYSKKELQFQRKTLEQRWMIFSALAALVSLGIILFIINKNRSRLNIANRQLQQKNKEVEQQKLTLEDTLNKLQSTQAQLIHAEKMASLGELTAGIAHEIQNPLNFVNNFSEVSKEMIEDIEVEMKNGNQEEVSALLAEIKSNLDKIENHGKRADGIVKSMLYHSRTSSGKKVMTALNELCDEYVKLSYHGMRAKDKSFNARLVFSYDPAVGEMELMPQEIGRVMLNLLNNAFFAVAKKAGTAPADYMPTVKISTLREANSVQIVVEDNGTGIPPEISSKIFQPFFTTKPTGSGTGLGLSISYDIITKVHLGEIDLESVPNEFTRFVIKLPAERAGVNL